MSNDPELSRPYLSSSPTNGIESMKENWIAKNPYDLLVNIKFLLNPCGKNYQF